MFEAPSGKTYITGRTLRLPSGLSTTSRIRAAISRRLSTSFPRSSRRMGRPKRGRGKRSRGSHRPLTAATEPCTHGNLQWCWVVTAVPSRTTPTCCRNESGAPPRPRPPGAASGRLSVLRPAVAVRRLLAHGPDRRAQQNARRNLASVASNANASTSVVAFGLVAPSGKTYITARPERCLGVYPRVSKLAAAIRGPCPQASHGRCA